MAQDPLCLVAIMLTTLMFGSVTPAGAAPTDTLPAWFLESVARDRHTTFLARFDDSATHADYACWIADGIGRAFREVPGRTGKGVEVVDIGAQVNFAGRSNFPADRGTAQFWVRGAVQPPMWNDGKDHWLFSTQAMAGQLELRKTADNQLELSWGRRRLTERETAAALAVPVGHLQPDAWHHIAFSWDLRQGKLWLAVDRDLSTARFDPPAQVDEVAIFFIGACQDGGIMDDGHDPLFLVATAGAAFDDLKISDAAIPQLISLHGREQQCLPEPLALRLQDGLRKHLDFIATLQQDGAWGGNVYSWPHLLPGDSGYRTWFHTGEAVAKMSGTTQMAMLFLNAYQVLGDRRYLEVARKSGWWVRSAQQPEGYWTHWYNRGASPPTPRWGLEGRNLDYEGRAYFWDRAQSGPALLMAYLYLETGEPQWLETFIKSADFILGARNPNGSWACRYNVPAKVRENHLGNTDGGEFNNGAVQYQMAAMLAAYHLTRDRKYLDAVRDAGDWVISAQVGPPTYGWSSQYDGQNKPAWARASEPPGVSMGGTYGATGLLLFMFDLTGDPKYLAPLEKYIAWEKSATVRLRIPKGEVEAVAQRHDDATGRPIMALNAQIIHLDSAQERKTILADPMVNPEGRSDEEFPWFGTYYVAPSWRGLEQQLMKRRQQGGRLRLQPSSRDEVAQSAEALKPEAERLLAQQNERGVWLLTWEHPAFVGSYFKLEEDRPATLLRLLQRAEILSGELDQQIWRSPAAALGLQDHIAWLNFDR